MASSFTDNGDKVKNKWHARIHVELSDGENGYAHTVTGTVTVKLIVDKGKFKKDPTGSLSLVLKRTSPSEEVKLRQNLSAWKIVSSSDDEYTLVSKAEFSCVRDYEKDRSFQARVKLVKKGDYAGSSTATVEWTLVHQETQKPARPSITINQISLVGDSNENAYPTKTTGHLRVNVTMTVPATKNRPVKGVILRLYRQGYLPTETDGYADQHGQTYPYDDIAYRLRASRDLTKKYNFSVNKKKTTKKTFTIHIFKSSYVDECGVKSNSILYRKTKGKKLPKGYYIGIGRGRNFRFKVVSYNSIDGKRRKSRPSAFSQKFFTILKRPSVVAYRDYIRTVTEDGVTYRATNDSVAQENYLTASAVAYDVNSNIASLYVRSPASLETEWEEEEFTRAWYSSTGEYSCDELPFTTVKVYAISRTPKVDSSITLLYNGAASWARPHDKLGLSTSLDGSMLSPVSAPARLPYVSTHETAARILVFSGKTFDYLFDLTPYVSNCSFEQGLLGETTSSVTFSPLSSTTDAEINRLLNLTAPMKHVILCCRDINALGGGLVTQRSIDVSANSVTLTLQSVEAVMGSSYVRRVDSFPGADEEDVDDDDGISQGLAVINLMNARLPKPYSTYFAYTNRSGGGIDIADMETRARQYKTLEFTTLLDAVSDLEEVDEDGPLYMWCGWQFEASSSSTRSALANVSETTALKAIPIMYMAQTKVKYSNNILFSPNKLTTLTFDEDYSSGNYANRVNVYGTWETADDDSTKSVTVQSGWKKASRNGRPVLRLAQQTDIDRKTRSGTKTAFGKLAKKKASSLEYGTLSISLTSPLTENLVRMFTSNIQLLKPLYLTLPDNNRLAALAFDDYNSHLLITGWTIDFDGAWSLSVDMRRWDELGIDYAQDD